MIAYGGTSQGGSQGWFWQRVSGVLLVVFLVGHFLLKHFGLEHASGGEITYAAVSLQLSNPWWVVFELGFLVVALWHGLNGVWMVAGDYVHGSVLRVGLYTFLWILGAGLLLAGVVTLVGFVR